MTERLVVLQTPHPRGLLRELRTNPEQQRQQLRAHLPDEGAHLQLSATGLAAWSGTPPPAPATRGLARSDFEAMLTIKAHYPREPYADLPLPTCRSPSSSPRLIDPSSSPPPQWHLNWVDAPVTIMTIPAPATSSTRRPDTADAHHQTLVADHRTAARNRVGGAGRAARSASVHRPAGAGGRGRCRPAAIGARLEARVDVARSARA